MRFFIYHPATLRESADGVEPHPVLANYVIYVSNIVFMNLHMASDSQG